MNSDVYFVGLSSMKFIINFWSLMVYSIEWFLLRIIVGFRLGYREKKFNGITAQQICAIVMPYMNTAILTQGLCSMKCNIERPLVNRWESSDDVFGN